MCAQEGLVFLDDDDDQHEPHDFWEGAKAELRKENRLCVDFEWSKNIKKLEIVMKVYIVVYWMLIIFLGQTRQPVLWIMSRD